MQLAGEGKNTNFDEILKEVHKNGANAVSVFKTAGLYGVIFSATMAMKICCALSEVTADQCPDDIEMSKRFLRKFEVCLAKCVNRCEGMNFPEDSPDVVDPDEKGAVPQTEPQPDDNRSFATKGETECTE